MSEVFSKKKLALDISANTLQIGITQIFGFVIFYLTSRYLDKNLFGDLNWSMAVSSTVLTIASLGLDVVFIKRITLKYAMRTNVGIHFFHTICISAFLTILVIVLVFFIPAFENNHPAFLMMFITLSVLNVSSTFRLSMIGIEAFKGLAIIALITNIFKLGVVVIAYKYKVFTLYNILFGYLVGNLMEFILGYLYISKYLHYPIKPLWSPLRYIQFIKISLPQLGVVILDTIIGRIDWILLGILTTTTITADYSFAYKMYESSKLPLTILTPILFTRFSKILNSKQIQLQDINTITNFFKWELFIISLIPLVLICIWSPLVDYFTENKYGKTNETCYTILAICVPLQAIINYLWSIGFAQGQIKSILYITLSAAVINLLFNILLIPYYQAIGAAIAFLISTIFQTLLYIIYITQNDLKLHYKTCVLMFLNSSLSILISKYIFENYIAQGCFAICIYGILALLSKQVQFKLTGIFKE